jgi:hypothetical protein
VLSITNFTNSSPPPSSKALVFNDAPYGNTGPVRSASASSAGLSSTYYSSNGSPHDEQLQPNRPGSSGRPGFASFPAAPVRRSKAAEAAAEAPEDEVVIQHQDGGAVVRELPPPYADRTLANGAGGSGSGPSSS